MVAKSTVCLALFLLLPSAASSAPDTREGRLLRFPDISRTQVAFVYANDIWVAPREGGMAMRLTTHAGQEWFPRFSPDGKWIAFTGDYDGNRDVYVVPATGGEPRRLTYSPDASGEVAERFGPDNLVMGWTPDGRVYYRSRRDQWNVFMGRIWTVPLEGGLPEALPLPYSGFLTYSPDGKRVAYNPTFREFRTWKRYRGGMAPDVYVHDLATHREERITTHDAVDDFPMWHQNSIYFVSERDGRANLYAHDLATGKTRQLTKYEKYDVKFPSLGPDAIVFEHAGWLHSLDLKTGKVKKISIQVPSDQVTARPRFVDVHDRISEFWLAPDAKRALVVARGELFTVPAEKGEIRNLTRTSGARERSTVWSPDGKWIAYLSDATGEYEVYIRSQDGKSEPIRLTNDGHCFRFQLAWSPDSKKLLFADKNLQLYWLDVDKKKVTLIDQAEYWEIRSYDWSPDSRWVAYAKTGKNLLDSIFIYNIENRKRRQVTSDFTEDSSPVFGPEGKHLYFLSSRDFNATMASFEMNFVYTRMKRPYAITLQGDLPSPFAPESDETGDKPPDEEKDQKGEKKKKKEEVKPVEIDFEGIESRVVAFPVKPGNYWGLRAVKGKLLWMSSPTRTLTGEPPGKSSLVLYDLKKRKEEIVHSPVDNYETAPGGKKLVYVTDKKYYIVDIKPGQKPGKEIKPLKLKGMSMLLDPRAEWRQIFDESWRLERDYFYAKNMHGVDWKDVRKRYRQLLPCVAHRSDLTYLLGEMIGELGTGHTYVGGGETPRTAPVSVGLLGAELELDPGSGRYRIAKIFEGQSWMPERRSPLTEPGLNVKAGDYILQINRRELQAPTHPGSLLLNRANRQTSLLVNRIPSRSGAREITVVPLAQDGQLRYYNWILHNRRYVDKQSQGRIGYIHLPNMGGAGLNEFARTYYPQVRKSALIIDVRWNGGGFVSEMILERLRRKLSGMSAPRNAKPFTYQGAVHHGPKVCLLNQWSASDGDLFPHYFRRFGLGKLVGKRSWGGVVGIRGQLNLVDGGYVWQPEFGNYDIDSRWIIENHGVEPDIEVDNLPADVIKGKDAQLDKAIELMLQELKKKSYQLPPRPPDPTNR